MSIERLGNALPETGEERLIGRPGAVVGAGAIVGPVAIVGPADVVDPDAEAVEFVRFCYRRRAVAWPELYDEMCAVAARGDYRGMEYEELQRLGIGFALAALPRMAEMANRVIAQERRREPIAAIA